MKKEGKIIIVAQGGLANRMRAIASSLYYAKKTNRDLLVVWYKNKELNASFSDLFKNENVPFKIIEPNFLIYNIYYEQPRKKNFFISRIIRKLLGITTIIDIHNFPEELIIENLNNVTKRVIINSGLQFADYAPEILKEIFRFNEIVLERKNNILQGKSPDISIQIRRTDNIESIRHSPLHSFEKTINSQIKKNCNVSCFLATDDTQTKAYLLSKFPQNIIINPREARRDTKEGMIDAAAEMLIMSECKVIYGSFWSSFSEIAAFYGSKKLVVIKDN
ncbi:MAG: hypothetical protein J1E16_05950 [Muribaculaceae bacterium]|nr:hypothetical protein [Muribaculaceae bacterium]